MLLSFFNIFGKKIGPLDGYKKTIFSQAGEEGILEFLLKKINKNKLNNLNVIEFGAWDGIYLSNTFYFVQKYNSNALFIEKDKNKFVDLIKTAKKYPKIISLNCEVNSNIKSKYSLDNILKRCFKKNIDILSIDVDSFDLKIWKSLKNFFPKIIVIEINSEMGIYKKKKYSLNSKIQGNSFASTVEVALEKGYVLVSHIGNCIFVKKSLIKYLNFDKKFINDPALLYNNYWLSISPLLYYTEYVVNFFPKNIYKFIKFFK